MITNYSNTIFKALKSQSLVMAIRNCDDSVQILLCCCRHGVFKKAHFLIGYCLVSRDNLEMILDQTCVRPRVPPTQQDF